VSEPPEISRRTFVLGATATVAMSAAGAKDPVAATGGDGGDSGGLAAIFKVETG